MESIEQQALQTYQQNLQYLKKNHPQLYTKISTLDEAIGNGQYKEQYILEYKDEGYFDALHIESNSYLYGMNSKEYSQSIADVITLDKKGSIFEGQRELGYHPELLEELDEMPLEFKNGYWGGIRPIYYNFEHSSKNITSFREVKKVFFLDIRLGLHLSPIIDKLHSKYIFIYEKNLEIFRLSLFATSYYEIAKSCKLYFSIQDKEEVVKKECLNFIKQNNQFNLYIKHITLTQEYFEDLQKFQQYVFDQDYMLYSYATLLLNYTDAPYYMQKNFPFLNVSHKYLNSVFAEKPVLLLFSGPSTLKNIEFVKKYKDKFILVTALSTCKLLFKYNIKPDIIMHIDPQDENSLLLTKGIDKRFFNDTLFIFSSIVHKNITKFFSDKTIFFIPNMLGIKKDFYSLTASSVGEYTYAAMMLFGVQKMYLLGIDMALDSKTLKTHNEYHFDASFGKSDTDVVTQKITYVEGNFKPSVPTLIAYINSIRHFDVFTSVLKDSTHKFFNLSDGAKLSGCAPLHVEDIDIKHFAKFDKDTLQQDLKSFLYSISSDEFREVDKELIRYQINRGNHLLKIIQKYKHKIYKNSDEYLTNLLKLSSKLTETTKENQLLPKVYRYYFKIILSYIFDIFNTKELADEQAHIQKIDMILTKELERIGHLFVEKMQEYLK